MRPTRFAAAASRRLILMGVVPLIILGTISAGQMFDVGRRAIDTRNQLVADTVRIELDGFIREHVHVAEQLKGVTAKRDIQAILDSSTSNLSSLQSVMLIDDNGMVQAASVEPDTHARAADLIGTDQSRNPEYVAAVATDATAWSGVFTSSVTGERALAAAVPLEDVIVYLTIDLEGLSGRVARSSVEPDAVSMVFDREGTLLFHSDPTIAERRPNLRTLKPIADAMAGTTGNHIFDHDGQRMLGSTVRVGGPAWIVMVEQDWDDATRPIIALLAWIGVAVLATATLATAVAIYFSRDLSAPISQLQRYTETVREGQYGAELGTYRHREMAQLSASIRRMADAVRDRESDLATAKVSLQESNQALREVVRSTTEAMGKIVGGRDPYTQGHQVRVAKLAGDLAREIGCTPYETEGIELAALVHDIGKLAVPSEILVKPGRLSDIEYQFVQQHPLWGHDILQEIPFEWPIASIVLQHHERLDGSGYPGGLKGEEISLGARIIAVADVVEAMASHRPYRPSLGLDAALAEIASKPEMFDARVMAALVTLAESDRLVLDDWHDKPVAKSTDDAETDSGAAHESAPSA